MTAPGLGKKEPRLRRDWAAAREKVSARPCAEPADATAT